jgi:phage terminase small subunit
MPKKKAKKPGKLSIQQRRFVNNVLEGMDAKNAYIKAGYRARGHTAEVNGSRLLRNAKVQPPKKY